MDGAVFKERALVEGRRYAKDRMVFLRELAQNARDAGATRIDVATRLRDRQMVIRFTDNGTGMTFAHAERFLFRLYASSKETEKSSAGCFGVGFWSILLFEPDRIEIESRPVSGDPWQVRTDADLKTVSQRPGTLEHPGTIVTLYRRVRHADDYEQLVGEAWASLDRHCKHLRQSDKRATPLPVRFNQHSINAPFELDGPCWLTFSEGKTEGAVGLGESPSVEVYARGLLVWHGTLLEELAYGAKRATPLAHPKGLSPQYVLNGNDLNVTYDRRKVVDDRALARLRVKARRRMRELLVRYLDRLSPRPFHQRVLDAATAGWEDMTPGKRIGVGAALAAVLLFLAVGWWWQQTSSLQSRAPAQTIVVQSLNDGSPSIGGSTPLGNPGHYFGASTEATPLMSHLPLVYRPKKETAFRIAALEQLDPTRGIRQYPPTIEGPAPSFRCGGDCVDVAVEVDADAGPLVLPTPTGHAIEPRSVQLNRNPLPLMAIRETGEPAIWIDRPVRGTLTYRTGPSAWGMSKARRSTLLALPGEMRTRALDDLTASLKGLRSRRAVVDRARDLVTERIAYDNSAPVAEAYDAFFRSGADTSWLAFVLDYGRGDCDVKNTLLVMVLRRMGIPARLAVGPVGENGRTLPGLHAWTEYYLDGWHAADATGTNSTGNPPAAGPLAPGVPGPSPPASSTQVPAAAPPTAMSKTPEETAPSSGIGRMVALIAAVVGALSLLVGMLTLLAAGTKRPPIIAPGGRDKQRAVAADILASALAHPEMWMASSGLKRRRLLPVLGHRRGMSIDDATDRGRAGLLWMSAGKTALAKRGVARGAQILDSSDGPFQNVIARLPGIIDLDDIAGLAPFRPDAAPADIADVGRLVALMNQTLRRCGLRGLVFRLTRKHLSETARDIDLTGLGFKTSKYMVLSSQNADVLRWTETFRTDPLFAVFTALDGAARASAMLTPHRSAVLSEAALGIFEEARWNGR